VFGLDPATGKMKINCDSCSNPQPEYSGNMIYSSSDEAEEMGNNNLAPYGTTDPQYN